jgi:DNA recombination protein RmuC
MTRLLVAGAIAIAAASLGGIWVAAASLRRSLDARMAATDAELRRLGDATVWRERGTDSIRQEVTAFRAALEHLRVREEERRAREEQGWQTLHGLAAVLAGGQRTGRAGENILRECLAHLPPSMVVSDFRVNGRVVEFGLVLPDGRTLPVDSKWPAERELRALSEATDPIERDRLTREIERVVAARAREVSGYRDPAMTSPVAVAAVPDAAYVILRRAHADAFRQGVVVVPYSMSLPILLFLHGIVGRFGAAGDLAAALADVMTALEGMEGTIENKMARASAMLLNGTEELRGQVGKARATLSLAREAEAPADALPTPRLVGLRP